VGGTRAIADGAEAPSLWGARDLAEGVRPLAMPLSQRLWQVQAMRGAMFESWGNDG
jgi:hypothetical protein